MMQEQRELVFGWDPKCSKRSSGLFSVFKWFGNKESVSSASSSSCDSIESVFSTDTVASFAFVPPSSYRPFGAALQPEKFILPGPETATYRARVAQREVRREHDRNVTLRSKYNLYRDPEPDRGHSLPLLMSNKSVVEQQPGMHRRSASESSKHRRHVKGKRKAPQPPGLKAENSTLRRRKRLAPSPPNIICNDSLKLDHGILKSTKELSTTTKTTTTQLQEIIQTPRPWYKRTLSKYSEKKPDQEKRKSALSFLTNISELDREAMEIVGKENLKMKLLKNSNQAPAFMRPKPNENTKTNSDSWLSPKRKSAKDLIAKFNAITGVSKTTTTAGENNSTQITTNKQQQQKTTTNTNTTTTTTTNDDDDNNVVVVVAAEKKESSRTTAVVKPISRSQWICPKCTLENDYWRIICKVCSTIKPYFDDFTTSIATKPILLDNNNKSVNNETAQIKDTLYNTELRISELQREIFQSKYQKIDDDHNKKDHHLLLQADLCRKEDVILDNVSNKTNIFQVQYPKLSKLFNIELDDVDGINNKHAKNLKTNVNVEEKMKFGDEIGFCDEPKRKMKIEEKMILGDELSVEKPKVEHKKNELNEEEKRNSAKKEEREKLKKMLIEMKNSLPKRVNKNQQENNKQRVSLIEEQNEVIENEQLLLLKGEKGEEKKAELIIATTETVYENIKVKKPVKVSTSAQTNAVVRKNRNSTVEEEEEEVSEASGFHLIGEKDFAEASHTYANVYEALAGQADTLEINRLLRRLETAIAAGQMGPAAVLARDLAQLKLPLSVVRQKTLSTEEDLDKNNITASNHNSFNVDMFVEDKISHRGPFPLQVKESMSVAELKLVVEEKYKIPKEVQRWILGKELATDDSATLATHQVTSSGCPVFLYLVGPATKTANLANVQNAKPNDVDGDNVEETLAEVPLEGVQDDDDSETDEQELWCCKACTLLNVVGQAQCDACGLLAPDNTNQTDTYLQLVNLDNEDLVRNIEMFECLVCLAECPPGDGVTLRECLHQFCKICLANTIEFSEEAEVKCPYRDEVYSCDIALQDREVKALVSAAVYEQHLAKSVKQAENKMDKTFHCKTPDCKGWCIFEDNVNEFWCPVCKQINCLTCQVIHRNMNCKQYQERMKSQSETDEDARRTRDFLEDMMKRGEALACPTCQVVLLKKWGCDWLRCSMCKTEICWVTRGPRWGPAGKGDTSAGCKCGVNGIKCHPKCNYCH